MNFEELLEELKNLAISYINPDLNEGKLFLWLSSQLVKGKDTFDSFKLPEYSFKIGNLKISNPLVSAPLAGISDNTYRIFAAFFGCGLTFSEMITSYGIYYNHRKTISMASITECERPCAIQIFGSGPEIMAEAAERLEGIADIIDINMGCPVPKILKSKSGGYLLREPEKVGKIVKKIRERISIPLTVKVRLGWNKSSINVLDIAKIAQENGADAISIHGRTVKQGFSGNADYAYIKQVKNNIKIPVITSGDINSPKKAIEVLNYTGCDGLMVGRKSKGSMWIFLNILLKLQNPNKKLEGMGPSLEWRKKFTILYLKFLIYFKGEKKAIKEFRKYLSWIFKGIRGISKVRKKIFQIKEFNDVINILDLIDGM
ncbi:MAG: tRNA dihydrouridine synthase DusB [Candidatus Humimicrobiaceae bacterium]